MNKLVKDFFDYLEKQPRKQLYPIGTKFMSAGKYKRICTVTDFLRVVNSSGEVVKHYYETTHELAGMTVTDYETPEATITRGLIK